VLINTGGKRKSTRITTNANNQIITHKNHKKLLKWILSANIFVIFQLHSTKFTEYFWIISIVNLLIIFHLHCQGENDLQDAVEAGWAAAIESNCSKIRKNNGKKKNDTIYMTTSPVTQRKKNSTLKNDISHQLKYFDFFWIKLRNFSVVRLTVFD
jgi:hypothetical protein